MKVKKRKKTTRMRGTHTHWRGFKKKARGSGHRGGVGMAGTGKRGDAKKTMILNEYGNTYFKRDQKGEGLRERKRIHAISLTAINDSIHNLVKNGKAKEHSGAYEIDLSEFKVVGNDTKFKYKIKAHSASAGARKAVEKMGGEIAVKFAK